MGWGQTLKDDTSLLIILWKKITVYITVTLTVYITAIIKVKKSIYNNMISWKVSCVLMVFDVSWWLMSFFHMCFASSKPSIWKRATKWEGDKKGGVSSNLSPFGNDQKCILIMDDLKPDLYRYLMKSSKYG